MPDWQELVSQHLAGMALDADEKAEVHAELTAHLEESFEALRRRGLLEKEAAHRTLRQIGDWQSLRREVVVAKRRERPMKKRMHQLWVPGFLTLTLSIVFEWVLYKLGFQPRIISWGAPPGTLFYVPWLISLPFLGALGAYISSRAAGSRATVLLASTFPALALAFAFLVMSPIGWIIELVTGSDLDFKAVAGALLVEGIGWLLLPCVAFLLGGLFVQLLLSRRSSPSTVAID
jgi:hypothetical protein